METCCSIVALGTGWGARGSSLPDIQNRCLILTNTSASLSLLRKTPSHPLSPHQQYWHSRKSHKACECAAGTAGRPHPKANLDRWRAKQHSTSGHVSTLCCSFLNPTLNGSSLSLLADIQGLCTRMSLKTVIDDFFFPHSFLSTARLNLCGKYKGLLEYVQIC